MVKNILIPYDSSEQATRALDMGLELAKLYNAKINIITCIMIHPQVDPVMSAAYVETLKIQKQEAQKTLSELESKLKQTNVPFKPDVLESISITDVILSYSENHAIDLIVMGSRGLGGFKKMLLGSVASGVSQHSKCPVLIVK